MKKKRIFSAVGALSLSVALLSTGITANATETANSEDINYIIGDVNFDEKISVEDATNIQKNIAGLMSFANAQTAVADVNTDGKVNIEDVTLIQKYTADIADLDTKIPGQLIISNPSNIIYHEAVYKTIYHPAVTHTVNHPAETEQVKVVDKEAYTYEEPVYEKHERAICNDCGADITDMSDDEIDLHLYNHIMNGGKGSYRGEWKKVQVGTKTVTVPEEYHYETKVVKEACSETVVVKEAWTETVVVEEAYWGEAPTQAIWHEAVYKDVWVVDVPGYTYEMPIYEYQYKTICNTCGAYLSDMSDADALAHLKNHALNGENDSYTSKRIKVQVGTQTITVPEEGHYEKQLVTAGYWEYR